MDQPVLTVEQLTKTYRLGKVRALDNLSLSFAQGVYGILGPNGAGKSTLMSIITGAVKADEGRVLYRGEDVSTDWQAFKKHFGYMPQQQQIYPHMTVADFLCYIAALKGLDKIEIRTQVREVIQRTDLEEYASRKLGALSGGMKQRVLISQALLGDPDILILDEPTAGLDPRERVRVRNFISELSLHKTILLATHVVSDIESVARHIIFMKCGQVLLTGTPADILQRNDHIAWEFEVKQEEIPALLPNFNISHLQQMADGSIKVRITADELPQSLASFQAHAVKPTLEDCYLHYFGDEPDSDNEHKAVSKSWGKRR